MPTRDREPAAAHRHLVLLLPRRPGAARSSRARRCSTSRSRCSNWSGRTGALAYPVPDRRRRRRDRSTTTSTDLDGLLLQGGSDVCPRSYGEEPLRPRVGGRRASATATRSSSSTRSTPRASRCSASAAASRSSTSRSAARSTRTSPPSMPDACAIANRRSTTATSTTVDVVAGSRLAELYAGRARHGQQRPPPGGQGPGRRASSSRRVSPTDGIVEAIRRPGGRYVAGGAVAPGVHPVRRHGAARDDADPRRLPRRAFVARPRRR